jgi:hypothetical protein
MASTAKESVAKRVVSASLGTSARNKCTEATFFGQTYWLERIGTDGDTERLKRLIAELDGHADAIGLGGTNLYLSAGDRKYTVRSSAQYAAIAKQTPVVDGHGIKRYIEPELIRYLDRETPYKLRGAKVLHVCAVDRWGMAQAMHELGAELILGDLMFAIGIGVPLRSLRTVEILGRLLLPIIVRMRTETVGYPTGEKQRRATQRFERYYRWADYISGDYLFIRKHLPNDMSGKVVITNSVTEQDVEDLRQRGVRAFVTASPRIDGRSFATNVLEGVLVASLGKPPSELGREEYLEFARRLNWQPYIETL